MGKETEMGIQCHVNLNDLPDNILVRFNKEQDEDQHFWFNTATLIFVPGVCELIFDRYDEWLVVDCNEWGGNRKVYIPLLEQHGITYVLS
jgi:hypothetical protein